MGEDIDLCSKNIAIASLFILEAKIIFPSTNMNITIMQLRLNCSHGQGLFKISQASVA